MNLTLVGRGAPAPEQVASAFATCFAALAAALCGLYGGGAGATPYAAALAWALAAVRHKLLHPVAIETANNPAIAEAGEVARTALEMTAGLCSSFIIITIFCVQLYVGTIYMRR